MNLPNEEARVHQLRQRLPAVTGVVYMNTGTNGPLPDTTAAALTDMFQHQVSRGRVGPGAFEPVGQARDAAREGLARILGADPGQVALTHHTTTGMNIGLHGVDWRPGDEIITSTLEHPGLLTPLSVLARRRGVRVRFAAVGRGEADRVLAAVKDCAGPRTRMVAISHVFWATGAVVPLAELAHWARERDIMVLVDGAQSAGALPLAVSDLAVDAYAVPGQKWLLGPDGTGGLYVSSPALDRLEPTFAGYTTAARQPSRDAFYVPSEGARRYEPGGMFGPALAGLAASLAFIEEVGLDWIQGRIAHLTARARERWSGVPGVEVLTPPAGRGPVSGLLTLKVRDREDQDVVDGLSRRNILARTVPVAPCGVRFSLGFYNLEEEVETVAATLEEISAG